MFDRLLKGFGEILSNDAKRKEILAKLKRGFRRIISILCLVCAGVLILVPFLLRAVGENNVTFAFTLYTPLVVFLAPPLLLLPIALIFHWKMAPILVGASVIFLHFGMGWEFRSVRKPAPGVPGETLTVMTYNRGQHMNQSLQPFKNKIDPDIIAFQEAGGRAAGYAKAEGYEKFTSTADAGEFTLLSRFPVLSKTLIEIPDGERPMAPAARFEIDFDGQLIAVFAVHFLSPRDTLGYYRRGAFLYGIIGIPGTSWGEKRKINQQFWDNRIAQSSELARIISEDSLPTIVVGDFNAPAGGYIHGIFLDDLKDAHQESGSGFGHSFPGKTRNPLSLGGPWMRIDYLFSNENWNTEWCITEKDRPSQHRAVAAQFRLLPAP